MPDRESASGGGGADTDGGGGDDGGGGKRTVDGEVTGYLCASRKGEGASRERREGAKDVGHLCSGDGAVRDLRVDEVDVLDTVDVLCQG